MSIDKKYTEGYVRMILPNVTLYWAKVLTPDTEFGKNEWCVDIAIPDEVLASALKKEGFNIQDKEYKSAGTVKNVLKAKRQVMRKDGTKQEPPKVWHPDAVTPFTKDLGNGTVANVKLSARAWQVKGKWHLSAYIEEIQVVDHKEYAGGTSFSPIVSPF